MPPVLTWTEFDSIETTSPTFSPWESQTSQPGWIPWISGMFMNNLPVPLSVSHARTGGCDSAVSTGLSDALQRLVRRDLRGEPRRVERRRWMRDERAELARNADGRPASVRDHPVGVGPGGQFPGRRPELGPAACPDFPIPNHLGADRELTPGRHGLEDPELDATNEPREPSFGVPRPCESQPFGVNPRDVLRPAQQGGGSYQAVRVGLVEADAVR